MSLMDQEGEDGSEWPELTEDEDWATGFSDPLGDPIEPWTAPPLPFDIELDHLIGEPDFLTAVLEEDAGRALNTSIRRLPRSLRKLARRLKHDMHRQALVDHIEREVRRRCTLANTRCIDVPGQLFEERYIVEIHRRAALADMARDSQTLVSLRDEIARVKKEGYLVNAYGGPPRTIPELPRCTIPRSGPWKAESSVGLSTSPVPEAMPEAVAVAFARRFWARFQFHAPQRRPVARVLHWGALNSTLGIALGAVAPDGLTLTIDEVDTVGQPPSRSWSGQRFTNLSEVRNSYDLILVHVPPAAIGANHIRNRFKDLAGPNIGEIHLDDIGRLGPKKWQQRVLRLLRSVMPRLKNDADLFLVLPRAIRVAPLVDGYPCWGYEFSPQLLECVEKLLGTSGLVPLFDLEVDEMNAMDQPFFRQRRCPWRVLGLSRRPERYIQSNDADELFASLEDDLV